MLKRLVQKRRHGNGPHGHLFETPDGSELMALDCETTGLDPRRAELVSVAAVPIRAGRVCAGAALTFIWRRHPAWMASRFAFTVCAAWIWPRAWTWKTPWSNCWPSLATGPWWAGAWISIWR